jgi:hypothetical protein
MQSGDRSQIAKHAFPQQPLPVLCFPRGKKLQILLIYMNLYFLKSFYNAIWGQVPNCKT